MSKKHNLFLRIAVIFLAVIAIAVCYLQLHGSFQSDVLKTDESLQSGNSFIVPDNTDIAAHRMGAGLFPEDTMMSAEGLIADTEKGLYRVDVIEVDLWLTRDKELILLHDDTLDRTTDSVAVFGTENAKPGDYMLSELQQLNFGAKFQNAEGEYPYSGLTGDSVPDDLRVLTLRQLLDYLTANGDFKYILEIKDSGADGIEAMDKLAAIVKEYGLEEKTVIGSFHEELLFYLDEKYPELHRNAALSEAVTFTIDFLTNKNIESCSYPYEVFIITPRYGLLLGCEPAGQRYGLMNLMSQGFINRAHKCGIATYYWTVNDEPTMNRLLNRNADCIITDYPNIVD